MFTKLYMHWLQALLDKEGSKMFAEEIAEQYDALRTEFYAGLSDRTYVDMPIARKNAFQVPVILFSKLDETLGVERVSMSI